ncbi:MAG TPA: hypothetical protein VGK50_00725 [Coriobacteriia bacterium]
MGLQMALTQLHPDRSVDAVVRDVLVFFNSHPGEPFSPFEVARRTSRPYTQVEPILLTLGRCFVLDFQSDPPSFRYLTDPVLDMEVERFLRRVGTVEGRLQDNVARFRQRHETF